MNQPSIVADKNIVDRTHSPRNPKTARTVRETRARLQSANPQNPEYHCELMATYLRAASLGAAVMPLLVMVTAGIDFVLFRGPDIVYWAILTLSIYGIHAFLTKQASRTRLDLDNVTTWERRFRAIHGFAGICWGLFSFVGCSACDPQAFVFFKGVVLLTVIAATAMTSPALGRRPLFVFTAPVGILFIASASPTNPFEMAILALIISTFILFTIVSGRLYKSHIAMLSIQAEKEWLITELEMAKSMSDEARRRAEEANLAKSRFLASMSHELRTPLNAILGFSEVMENELLGPLQNETYKEYASDIHRSGNHLLNLINEILDLSRIEAGRYELREEPVALKKVAEDCIGMIELKARNKGITIQRQYERILPRIWIDEKAIRQVILNLISNAVKFTPRGGHITLKVGWTAGGGQYLSVHDNGPGIPEDEIPVVLSAFGQGSIAIKSAEQGTGLGLPIVQAILAEHGGEFVFKSKLRSGTEATAILPRNRVEIEAPGIETPEPEHARRRRFV